MVPSAVELLRPASVLDRVGAWRPLERYLLVGRQALIGRPALAGAHGRGAFVPTFKQALMEDALQPVARVGRCNVSARQAVLTRTLCVSV
jgi:hypothetical protein